MVFTGFLVADRWCVQAPATKSEGTLVQINTFSRSMVRNGIMSFVACHTGLAGVCPFQVGASGTGVRTSDSLLGLRMRFIR